MSLQDIILQEYRELEGESIVEIIRKKLLGHHLGKRRAIKRKFLLSYCKYFEHGISDREMRRIYTSILPVAWCRKGIFVVDEPDEVDKIVQTIDRSIDKLGERKAMLLKHKKYLIEKKQGQMELDF